MIPSLGQMGIPLAQADASRNPEDTHHYYLLLNTVQGSRLEIPSALMGLVSHRASVIVERGSLLLEKKQPKHYKYILARDPLVNLPAAGTQVAPLDLTGFQLLEAIPYLSARINVYETSQLEFGRVVSVGTKVCLVEPKTSSGYAAAIVRYKGPVVGSQPGIMFGVEFLGKDCKYGDNDGSFQGTIYFTCAMGYGKFVSLDQLLRLSNETYIPQRQNQQQLRVSPTPLVPSMAGNGGLQCGQVVAIAMSSKFELGNCARATDVKGKFVEGVVKWMGKSQPSGHIIIGIKTDKPFQVDDFPYKINGLDHTIPAPVMQALFLHETLVENLTTGICLPVEKSSIKSMGGDYAAQKEEFRKILIEAGDDTNTVEEQFQEWIKLQEKIEVEKSKKQSNGQIHGGPAAECENKTNERTDDKISMKEISMNSLPIMKLQTRRQEEENGKDKTISSQAPRCNSPNFHSRSCPSLPSVSVNSKPSNYMGTTLAVGSHVQIFCAEPNQLAYGIIRWIGRIANEPEIIAGIEMEETVAGGTDGTWTDATACVHQFFVCPPGRGLYYPLSKLQHDERRLDPAFWKNQMKEMEAAFQARMRSEESECHSKLEQVKTNLQMRDTEIERLRNEVARKDSELSDLKLMIELKEEDIHQLKETVMAQNGEIQEKYLLLSAKSCEIVGLSSGIRVKDEEISSLQEQIREKDETNSQLQNTIDQLTAQLRQRDTSFDHDDNSPHWTTIHSTPAPWKIDRSALLTVSKTRLGSGAWGVVYSGCFRGEPVAIKQAHQEILQMDNIVDMIKREIGIMAHVQHPNLVRFIGAVLDDNVYARIEAPIIVLELLDMNLREAYKREKLGHSTMASLFCDVAYALHYLHEQRSPIIHRDVSAPNVLLNTLQNGLFRAKVSDFGSANLVKNSRTEGPGAIIYTAPEMYPVQDDNQPRPKQTVKVDVFSYGILMLEVICKELPTIEKREAQMESCRVQWRRSYDLIVECTKRNPELRPNMRQILYTLNWTN